MGSEQAPGLPDRSKVDLTPHPLVPHFDQLGDATEEGLSTLVGFIGPSRREGRVRIYLDLRFDSYCEVSTADVVQTGSVDASDANSPSIVWVRSSAEVQLVRVSRLTGHATFVTGAIRKRYYRRATLRSYEEDTFEDTVPPVCDTEIEDCGDPDSILCTSH